MQSLDKAVHSRHADPPPDIQYRGADRVKVKRLTHRQRLFVEDCLTSQETFDDVMKKHHVTNERYGNWLRGASFRNYMKRIYRSLDEQTRFISKIGGKRAAMFLLRTASFTEKDTRIDLIRSSRCKAAEGLLRSSFMLLRHDQIAAASPDRPLEKQLAHPDHSPQEILRLLDIVEGKEPAD